MTVVGKVLFWRTSSVIPLLFIPRKHLPVTCFMGVVLTSQSFLSGLIEVCQELFPGESTPECPFDTIVQFGLFLLRDRQSEIL